MSIYLLDTSALLALRDNEPRAERVAGLLEAATRKELACHGCLLPQIFFCKHFCKIDEILS
jgi:ribonuclease VapC